MTDDLKPGSEMDQEVARALGWKFWMEKRGGYQHVVAQASGDPEPWTKYQNGEAAKARYTEIAVSDISNQHHIVHLDHFRPSTGISDAIAALETTGEVYDITKSSEGYEVSFYSWAPIDGGSWPFAIAATLPEACCLAILAWAKAKEEA